MCKVLSASTVFRIQIQRVDFVHQLVTMLTFFFNRQAVSGDIPEHGTYPAHLQW